MRHDYNALIYTQVYWTNRIRQWSKYWPPCTGQVAFMYVCVVYIVVNLEMKDLGGLIIGS